MRKLAPFFVLAAALVLIATLDSRPGSAQETPDACVACHEKLNPGIVKQWKASAHAKAEDLQVGCAVCHGSDHQTDADVVKVKMPTPKLCRVCHKEQVEQFAKGKHALAEKSAAAIPMMAAQPVSIQKFGCSACHDVGKTFEDGSVGKCDSCHTRHLYSKKEAQQPEACRTCHMGEDHGQYEMWSSSKHGVIHGLEPESGRAPVCQTCHMQKGDHAVMTGWGFLGLRLPIQDPEWQTDVLTIAKAVGPWGRDEAGMNARVAALKSLKLLRFDDGEFWDARRKMIKACKQCHSERFAKEHLHLADEVIRETTRVLAEGVQIVEGLFADGILPEAEDGPKQPDLLLFYDSPTEIEQELYHLFLFHRQKAFQGVIHANPDYMHWYGWAPMKTSLQKIKALAKEMRITASREGRQGREK